jgi:hypothetical protein
MDVSDRIISNFQLVGMLRTRKIAGKNKSLGKYKNLEFPYCRKFRRTNAEARRKVEKRFIDLFPRAKNQANGLYFPGTATG